MVVLIAGSGHRFEFGCPWGLPPRHLAQQSPCHHPRRSKRLISEGTTAFKSTHRHLASKERHSRHWGGQSESGIKEKIRGQLLAAKSALKEADLSASGGKAQLT
jgi:hypothetical protein